MPCALLAIPLLTIIREKVEISPQCPVVKALVGDYSLLEGHAWKVVELPGSLVQMETRRTLSQLLH